MQIIKHNDNNYKKKKIVCNYTFSLIKTHAKISNLNYAIYLTTKKKRKEEKKI
jgi:hypothetical protein